MVRKDWLDLMLKIADPVLLNLASGKLRGTLPVEKPGREQFAHLEAFGRTLTGIAPWLGLKGLAGEEKSLQDKYRAVTLKCFDNATDPGSPDRMNFSEGYGQALVDAAFLSHAIIRAPHALYEPLDNGVKKNLADCLMATRVFKPCDNNWLFFSAMVEAALYVMGEEWNPTPIKRAVSAFEKWYVGDGMYGDGDFFHFDYYNSFVISPMYVDLLETFAPIIPEYAELLPKVIKRASRYAGILERMISPEGTYPMTGRSITYRFGAFQALSQAAFMENLPSDISYAQVRCGLSAVIERTAAGGIFDENNFLKIGVCGSQPSLGEGYICVGSLYLCTTVFLPLGLLPSHPFWTAPDEPWTNKKIWSGVDVPCDHSED